MLFIIFRTIWLPEKIVAEQFWLLVNLGFPVQMLTFVTMSCFHVTMPAQTNPPIVNSRILGPKMGIISVRNLIAVNRTATV